MLSGDPAKLAQVVLRWLTQRGVVAMLKGHFGIAMNIGVTEAQMLDLLSIVEANIGAEEASVGRKVLKEVFGLGK